MMDALGTVVRRSQRFAWLIALIALIVFAERLVDAHGTLGRISRQTATLLTGSRIQSVVVFFLAVDIAGCLLIRLRAGFEVRTRLEVLALASLGGSILAGSISYVSNHTAADQFLILLFGILAGLGVKLLDSPARFSKMKDKNGLLPSIVFSLVILFVAGSVWQPKSENVFQYRTQIRSTGAWDNPNFFGLFMGAGLVLAMGGFLKTLFDNQKHKKPSATEDKPERINNRIFLFLWLIAGLLTALGLFRSYSRGAWVATACALAYLLWSKGRLPSPGLPPTTSFKVDLQTSESGMRNQGNRGSNWRPLAIIALSLIFITFWQFRFTEWRPARRLFSIVNINDFSWRNRVTAWNGAIRMMLDKPLFGCGWGQAELVYEKNYCPAPLENGAAIRMNDYFILGISAGAPALLCLLVYIGLSLTRKPKPGTQIPAGSDLIPFAPDRLILQAACRAGAIVFLVGFWFDGGLFKLATGSVFWILLELGRSDPQAISALARMRTAVEEQENAKTFSLRPLTLPVQDETAPTRDSRSLPPKQTLMTYRETAPYRYPRWETLLKNMAWVMAGAALLQTIVLIGAPFLPVNDTTLTIARKWLLPPKAVADLDFLVDSGPGETGSHRQSSELQLKVILQHATLANYNRELINWKLDDQTYREYVLTPAIDPERDGSLSWRRQLWEYFYPSIRNEIDAEAAAQVVSKFLHQHLAIIPEGPLTISEMWRRQLADQKGFQTITVAALRSVGIPARLKTDGRAEIFVEGAWRLAPQSVM